MRIIVAGGRDFNDFELLELNLNRLIDYLLKEAVISKNTEIEIVCGKAKGADALGEEFAKKYGLNIKYFPADWNRFGKSAGYKRNADMASYAKEEDGILVAFWDGKSKGTKHMIDTSKNIELKVFVLNY